MHYFFEVSLKIKRDILFHYINIHFNLTMGFDDSLFNFISLYSVLLLETSNLCLLTGGLNARSPEWWKNDHTAAEGLQIESFSSSCVLTQVISKPTLILPAST